MKRVIVAILGFVFLLTTKLAFSGIDYTDYRQEEWSHQHQENQNRDREREKEREQEKKYQHQNREVRDKTVRTMEHINSYPEKYIP